MSDDAFDSKVEAAMLVAVSNPKVVGPRPLTELERSAFRLGFLAGARFGLAALREVYKDICDD